MAYMKDSTGRRLDAFKVGNLTSGLTGLGLGGRLAPLFDHVGCPSQNGNNSGTTNTIGHYKLVHKALGTNGFTSVRLAFGNWHAFGFSGETLGTNDIEVRAAIELPTGGNALPVYFNGNRDITIKPGGTVWSDPVGIDALPGEFTQLVSRTRVKVVAGGSWYYTTHVSANQRAGEGLKVGTTDEDLTTTGTITGGNGWAYGPLAMLCDTAEWVPIVGVLGDSIARGEGDKSSALDGNAYRGFINRACLVNGVPVVNMANAGDRVTNFLSRQLSQRRRAYLPGCTDVIYEYGINDFDGALRTFAQVAADAIIVWRQQANSNTRVWATTVTPFSTSTDGYATVANQTVKESNTARVPYNNWLRDGAPLNSSTFAQLAVGASGAGVVRAGQAGHPLEGYFEVTDIVESARDSGKWKAPNRAVTDAAITTGTSALTSATAAFTSADLGRAVLVEGAGSEGARLTTIITVVNSATSVTVENNASTTVSGATLTIGVPAIDGLHPTSEYAILMAAAVDTSKFLTPP